MTKRVCCLYRVSTDKQVDYDSNHKAKKMIVNSMIKRIEVFRDYKLNIEFSFDLQQFMNGIDCEPLKAS